MNEKTKKYLIVLAYRTAVSIGLFLIIFITGVFAPSFIDKISPLWTKSIDFQKVGKLFCELFGELFPF